MALGAGVMDRHVQFMAMAIAEALGGAASGEQPFGAVLVLDGAVIARTHSRKATTFDPTALAVTLAVKAACQAMRRCTLHGAVLYSTCEPCPMGLGAMQSSGIRSLVIGARYREVRSLGAPVLELGDYRVERLAAMLGWQISVVDGVLSEACANLYCGTGLTSTVR